METAAPLCVWGISGQEVAAIPREQLSTVRALKQQLRGLCGCSRFRQQLLHNGAALEDEVRLDGGAEATHVSLVLLPFCDVSAHQVVGELRFLCGLGHAQAVERRLQERWDPNLTPVPGSTTPLIAAAQGGYSAIVRLLLEAGARVDGPTEEELVAAAHLGYMDVVRKGIRASSTALTAAVNIGRADIVQLLLEAGASVDGLAAEAFVDAAGCGYTDIVRLLLEAGADKDACCQDWEGRSATALAAATTEGQSDAARLLLKAGARVDGSAVKALLDSVGTGQVEADVVRLFLEASTDKETCEDCGTTILAAAAGIGRADIVRVVLAAGARVDTSAKKAMVNAAGNGHADVVHSFLEVGTDKNTCDERGITVLASAVSAGRAGIVRLLLEAGARFDESTQSAVVYAAGRGHADVVCLLLEVGAGRDACGQRWAKKALAAAVSNGREDVIRLLLEAGIRVEGPAS